MHIKSAAKTTRKYRLLMHKISFGIYCKYIIGLILNIYL